MGSLTQAIINNASTNNNIICNHISSSRVYPIQDNRQIWKYKHKVNDNYKLIYAAVIIILLLLAVLTN